MWWDCSTDYTYTRNMYTYIHTYTYIQEISVYVYGYIIHTHIHTFTSIHLLSFLYYVHILMFWIISGSKYYKAPKDALVYRPTLPCPYHVTAMLFQLAKLDQSPSQPICPITERLREGKSKLRLEVEGTLEIGPLPQNTSCIALMIPEIHPLENSFFFKDFLCS